MSSSWPSRGFDESSSEELERSMEHEVEGLMEIDDLDLLPSESEQATEEELLQQTTEEELLRVRRAGPRAGASPGRGQPAAEPLG